MFVTGGFSVMASEEKIKTLETLAKKTGIVILTDSDTAGFRIRNYIKNKLSGFSVKDAFIPDVPGKERRKRIPGREGLLGVEGMADGVIIDALKKAGCEIGGQILKASENRITKTDLYLLGISGGSDSRKKKQYLAGRLGLPSKMSSNMLCTVLSRITTIDDIKKIMSGYNFD